MTMFGKTKGYLLLSFKDKPLLSMFVKGPKIMGKHQGR